MLKQLIALPVAILTVCLLLTGCEDELVSPAAPDSSSENVVSSAVAARSIDAKQTMFVEASSKPGQSIKLSWSGVPYASQGYRIRYRLKDTDTWEEQDLSETTFTIITNSNEIYEVEVLAIGRGGLIINSTSNITVSNIPASNKDNA